MSTNWLGVAAINFGDVEDKQTKDSFEILPQGWYKASIKSAVVGVVGAKNAAVLNVFFDLEGEKEVSEAYYLPTGDAEKDVFKNERLRNLFTRVIFADLTYEEYKKIPTADINAALTALQSNPNGPALLAGKKVLVNIVQDPFISTDKATKAVQFTDTPKAYVMAEMPKQILSRIEEIEKAGVVCAKMPKFLFSNKVSGHGIGFYNSYEEKERKNSKAYTFIQSLGKPATSTEMVGETEAAY